MRRLGVHTSIAGGIHLSLGRAEALGCNTVQIFSHNPRSWFVPVIPEEAVSRFRELKRRYDIAPVFIHTSYLINLASRSPEIIRKSVRLLICEMDIADSLDADFVVLHTGSASQDDERAGRRRAIEVLRAVSQEKGWKSRLLLENTAGERGDVSSRIGNLAEMIGKTGSALIGGICLDTCHAFQAGYEISKKEGLTAIAEEIREHIGFDRTKLIHLNDSKKRFHSRVDRHEHIGKGSIGEAGLRRLVNHPSFRGIPLILETPKKSEDDDPRNLKAARRLFTGPGRD